jgi:hypothetical protein
VPTATRNRMVMLLILATLIATLIVWRTCPSEFENLETMSREDALRELRSWDPKKQIDAYLFAMEKETPAFTPMRDVVALLGPALVPYLAERIRRESREIVLRDLLWLSDQMACTNRLVQTDGTSLVQLGSALAAHKDAASQFQESIGSICALGDSLLKASEKSR